MVREVAAYLQKYVLMEDRSAVVLAAWLVSTRLLDHWDRFPLVAVVSPEKRCGKTRCLQVIQSVAVDPYRVDDATVAAVYRRLAKDRPTLLLDEAEALRRPVSESDARLAKVFKGSIDRDAHVDLCVGENHEPTMFPTYSAKVCALIGDPEGILADRCLIVRLRRKTKADTVAKFRKRKVAPEADALRDRVDRWAAGHAEEVAAVYDDLEFDLENDRLAELLEPLGAVLTVDDPGSIGELFGYAADHERHQRAAEQQSDGVRLLTGIREVFGGVKADPRTGDKFLATTELIRRLCKDEEAGWKTFSHGRAITAAKLAAVLRPYGVRSERPAWVPGRGFSDKSFAAAWRDFC